MNPFNNTRNKTMRKRVTGESCAFCGRKLLAMKDYILVQPNLNGFGLNTRAHLVCARKAGVTN